MAKLRINIDVPAPDNRAVSNVLGLLGVLGLPVSIGGLVGNWWWAALVASVLTLVVGAVAKHNAAVEDDQAAGTSGGPASAPVPPEKRVRFGLPDPEGRAG